MKTLGEGVTAENLQPKTPIVVRVRRKPRYRQDRALARRSPQEHPPQPLISATPSHLKGHRRPLRGTHPDAMGVISTPARLLGSRRSRLGTVAEG